MRIDQLQNLLVRMFATTISVKIISSPGVGKSQSVEQVCADLSVRLNRPVGLITMMLSTLASIDVGGFMIPCDDEFGLVDKISAFSLPPIIPHPSHFKRMNGGSHKVFIEGVEVNAYAGVPDFGVVFFDEFDQAPHEVQLPAADMFLNRRIRGDALPNGWVVWAASNRQEDRSGVQKELAFLTNRQLQIEVDAELDPWVEWARKNDIHPLLIAWAKWQPGVVFANSVPANPGPFCTPRTLSMLSQALTKISPVEGDNLPTDEMAVEVARGLIGEGAAAQVIAFARMAKDLPTFEEIVEHPSKAPVPMDKPDAILAICQLISHRVDEKTAEAAFIYISRVPAEFQVVTLQETIRHTPEVINNERFSEWLNKNQDLVLAATAVSA